MENKFKLGDTVERFQGGSHNDIPVGYIRVITDDKTYAGYQLDNKLQWHDEDNLRLVAPKDIIINNYQIY